MVPAPALELEAAPAAKAAHEHNYVNAHYITLAPNIVMFLIFKIEHISSVKVVSLEFLSIIN